MDFAADVYLSEAQNTHAPPLSYCMRVYSTVCLFTQGRGGGGGGGVSRTIE
jgi:hypothetical protein